MGREKGKVTANVNDIVGERLGKLEVVSYYGHIYEKTKGGDKTRHFYVVSCDCGVTKLMRRAVLKNGRTYNCGCERGRKKNDC